jgi:hypothetical protein
MRRRALLAFGAAAVCTLLAAQDGQSGFTISVGATTFVLALLSVFRRERDPRWAERRAKQEQDRVDGILWRYRREQAARDRREGRR